MTEYYSTPEATLYIGDVRDVLRELEPESVQTVVTSPPYWGLRDYGTATWCGGDADCSHLPPDEAGKTTKPTGGQRFHAGRFSGPTCWRCGAERVDRQLGLEPTPDCQRPLMELRSDLRAADLAFVHQQLKAVGLLDAFPYGMDGRALRRCSDHTEGVDAPPMTQDDGPLNDHHADHNQHSPNHLGSKQRDETLDTQASDSPQHEPKNDLHASLGAPGLRDDDCLAGDYRLVSPLSQSLVDVQELENGQPVTGRSSMPSQVDISSRDLSAYHDAQRKSSVVPARSERDSDVGSARLSDTRLSKTLVQVRHTAAYIDCSCGSSVWAYYILPQNLLRFYQPKLCGSCYVCRMVEVFREVRRILRKDGTCWLNLGDSYCAAGKGSLNGHEKSSLTSTRTQEHAPTGVNKLAVGLKPKDLVGIPWRVAFALQADGWYLRSDIVWCKSNPMPESVRDRPTKAHEYLFLLSKSQTYYYDAKAISEPAAWERWGDQSIIKPQPGTASWIKPKSKQELVGNRRYEGFNERWDKALSNGTAPKTRNKRSVWTIPTQPYPAAHFATFPEKLVEPCILAGSRPGDTVLDPFLGSGTTAQVALRHGRQVVGIDLKAEYLDLAIKRAQISSAKGDGGDYLDMAVKRVQVS